MESFVITQPMRLWKRAGQSAIVLPSFSVIKLHLMIVMKFSQLLELKSNSPLGSLSWTEKIVALPIDRNVWRF